MDELTEQQVQMINEQKDAQKQEKELSKRFFCMEMATRLAQSQTDCEWTAEDIKDSAVIYLEFLNTGK